MEENIYVDSREIRSTSNLNDQSKIAPLVDQDHMAEENIESNNQQPHKNNQSDLSDEESDNTYDREQKTAKTRHFACTPGIGKIVMRYIAEVICRHKCFKIFPVLFCKINNDLMEDSFYQMHKIF